MGTWTRTRALASTGPCVVPSTASATHHALSQCPLTPNAPASDQSPAIWISHMPSSWDAWCLCALSHSTLSLSTALLLASSPAFPRSLLPSWSAWCWPLLSIAACCVSCKSHLCCLQILPEPCCPLVVMVKSLTHDTLPGTVPLAPVDIMQGLVRALLCIAACCVSLTIPLLPAESIIWSLLPPWEWLSILMHMACCPAEFP